MRFRDFAQPASLADAVSALKTLGAAGYPVAGGTSVVFAAGNDEKVAVDINRLGLDGIARENGAFRVGAVTRIAELQKHREPGWVLDRVARHLASQQIRNMSTIGGNIARVFPWADFPVALLALDAVMIVREASERPVPADEYFSSQPARLFKNGALLAAVKVPAVGPGSGFGYHKETRTALGFSLMTAAALLRLEGGRIASARVALGAGVPFPARLAAVEQALTGKAGGEALFREAAAKGLAGLTFMPSDGFSEEYTTHLSQVVVRDALEQALATAKGGAS
jgi:aerobic carbon-monoxide dehydrogenase medium subunit